MRNKLAGAARAPSQLASPQHRYANAGKPDSNGYLLQLEYVPFGKLDPPYRPWMNLRAGPLHVGYSKFNGASSNYDHCGGSASDDNPLFPIAWAAQ